MIDFLEDNNLFYDNQFGFRKFHGTNHCDHYISRKGIKKHLIPGKFVNGVFFGPKKGL